MDVFCRIGTKMRSSHSMWTANSIDKQTNLRPAVLNTFGETDVNVTENYPFCEILLTSICSSGRIPQVKIANTPPFDVNIMDGRRHPCGS